MLLFHLAAFALADDLADDDTNQGEDPAAVQTCDDPEYYEASEGSLPSCPAYALECDDFEETVVYGDYVDGCCTSRHRQVRQVDPATGECEVVDDFQVTQTECHAYREDALDCEEGEVEVNVLYDGELCPDRIVERTGIHVVHESATECCAQCTFHAVDLVHLVEPNSEGELWECRVGEALFVSQACIDGLCDEWPFLDPSDLPDTDPGQVECSMP